MKHRLEIGGEVREVPYRLLPDGRLLLETDGRTTCAVTARDGAATWVFIDGRTWKVEDAGRAPSRRARGGGEDLGDVTPPMPAVVVGILVEPGDAVTKSQRLVVVSAMKMETALVSPHDGVVAQVRCEVGAKVAPGDVLVDVTPNGPGEDEPTEEE